MSPLWVPSALPSFTTAIFLCQRAQKAQKDVLQLLPYSCEKWVSQFCAPLYLPLFVYSYILSALPFMFVLLDGKFFIVDAPYTLTLGLFWMLHNIANKTIFHRELNFISQQQKQTLCIIANVFKS